MGIAINTPYLKTWSIELGRSRTDGTCAGIKLLSFGPQSLPCRDPDGHQSLQTKEKCEVANGSPKTRNASCPRVKFPPERRQFVDDRISTVFCSPIGKTVGPEAQQQLLYSPEATLYCNMVGAPAPIRRRMTRFRLFYTWGFYRQGSAQTLWVYVRPLIAG
jgi:hypothetical protein